MSAQVDDSTILPDFPGTVKMPQFDKLWMCLYAKLGKYIYKKYIKQILMSFSSLCRRTLCRYSPGCPKIRWSDLILDHFCSW